MENTFYLMPLAASICLLTALVQAWILTSVRYFKMTFFRRIFKNYKDLVRSHVDYLIMSALIMALYLMVQSMSLQVPEPILWLVFIGALYNPFGFILQAIKPDIAEGGFMKKVGVGIGFMPTTIGVGYVGCLVFMEALEKSF